MSAKIQSTNMILFVHPSVTRLELAAEASNESKQTQSQRKKGRQRKERKRMEATACCGSRGFPFTSSSSSSSCTKRTKTVHGKSSLLIKSMASQKPLPSAARTVGSKKVSPFLPFFIKPMFGDSSLFIFLYIFVLQLSFDKFWLFFIMVFT
uniref:Uncharacterized protein LOC105112540 n=1 Tax=Rhizophora mucronata TaxID=61149 RepID=A0A2P2JNF5_RHIMU